MKGGVMKASAVAIASAFVNFMICPWRQEDGMKCHSGGGGGGGREGKTGGVQRFFGTPMNNYPRVFNPLSIVFLQVKA